MRDRQRLPALLVDPFATGARPLRRGEALGVGAGALVYPPCRLEGLGGHGGEQVGVLDAAGADPSLDGPLGGDRAGSGDRIAGGVEESGGLELVVSPAEPVQVRERGLPASAGVAVVVFEDVVVLRAEPGGSLASGRRADGVAQPQLEPLLSARVVGLGGRVAGAPGDRIGEDPQPDRLPGGELPGELGGDRGDPVEHRGGVLQAHQRRHGHGDQDLVRAAGLLDGVDVHHGVGEDRVTQARAGHGPAPCGEVPVDVEGQRPLRPVPEGGALGLLHRARGDVEPMGEGLDLRDGSGDVQRRGPGLRVQLDELHRA